MAPPKRPLTDVEREIRQLSFELAPFWCVQRNDELGDGIAYALDKTDQLTCDLVFVLAGETLFQVLQQEEVDDGQSRSPGQ